MASTMKETENTLDRDNSSDGFPLLPIESLIHVIRGQQVMLDSDLARLYGVETRRLNEQVKRNIERFPDDFLIQLTKEETQDLMSQIATSSLKSQNVISSWGGSRKPPYAFTENGVAMLSSVLRSKTAIDDRFLIIDDTLYHIGASIKDLGKKLFAFSKMETSPDVILDNI